VNDLEKILEGPRYKNPHNLVIGSVNSLKNLQDLIGYNAIRAVKGGEKIGWRLCEEPANRQKLGNLKVLAAPDSPGPGFRGSPGYVLSQHSPPKFSQAHSSLPQFADDLPDCRFSIDHNPIHRETFVLTEVESVMSLPDRVSLSSEPGRQSNTNLPKINSTFFLPPLFRAGPWQPV
jgi:hypothetical protein